MSEEVSPERVAEIEKASKDKLEFLQREYWRVRNEKQRYMRCPYCTSDYRRKNFVGGKMVCCPMFAKAFEAILDRQDEVDRGLQMAEKLKGMVTSGIVQ